MIITNIELTSDHKRKLGIIGERQIPFIVAKSLTRTAQEAQANVRQHINKEFVIRKRSAGFPSSIAIKPAQKNKLEAEVYTMAGFAALQQLGGTRKPVKHNLAIPNYDNIKDVPLKKSSAQAKEKTFRMKVRGGDIIAKRENKQIKALYFLRRKADIPKRLDMLEIATNTARKRFEFHFNNIIKETY